LQNLKKKEKTVGCQIGVRYPRKPGGGLLPIPQLLDCDIPNAHCLAATNSSISGFAIFKYTLLDYKLLHGIRHKMFGKEKRNYNHSTDHD
jgi:hypothetical protein